MHKRHEKRHTFPKYKQAHGSLWKQPQMPEIVHCRCDKTIKTKFDQKRPSHLLLQLQCTLWVGTSVGGGVCRGNISEGWHICWEAYYWGWHISESSISVGACQWGQHICRGDMFVGVAHQWVVRTCGGWIWSFLTWLMSNRGELASVGWGSYWVTLRVFCWTTIFSVNFFQKTANEHSFLVINFHSFGEIRDILLNSSILMLNSMEEWLFLVMQKFAPSGPMF